MGAGMHDAVGANHIHPDHTPHRTVLPRGAVVSSRRQRAGRLRDDSDGGAR
jgi:hypothetical protein